MVATDATIDELVDKAGSYDAAAKRNATDQIKKLFRDARAEIQTLDQERISYHEIAIRQAGEIARLTVEVELQKAMTLQSQVAIELGDDSIGRLAAIVHDLASQARAAIPDPIKPYPGADSAPDSDPEDLVEPPVTRADIEQYAKIHLVSLGDAYRYFEAQGLDMSRLKDRDWWDRQS